MSLCHPTKRVDSPKRSFVSWRPLPVQPADACVLRERRDRCFEACEQAFNQRFGRQCADEAVAQAEQLGALAPVDDPDALLDAVLPHLTNDGVEPFLRAFLASPPRVGRKRTRSHWDCGESDGAPEAMCSAAGQDAGGGGFVDLEAGRSSYVKRFVILQFYSQSTHFVSMYMPM